MSILKKLEWYGSDTTYSYASVPDFWIGYRVTMRADRQKVLRVEYLGNKNDELGVFPTWEGASDAANADLERRVASLLKSTKPGIRNIAPLYYEPDDDAALSLGGSKE